MICTDDETLAERCRMMSLHGISKDAWNRYSQEGSWYYEIVAPGFKYNLTDIAAALGLSQLEKLDRMQQRRALIASRFDRAFASMQELQVPTAKTEVGHSRHLYPLRLNQDLLSIDRARFIDEMGLRNIGTSVHFIPLHLHPYYRETYGFSPDDFPNAARICSGGIAPHIQLHDRAGCHRRDRRGDRHRSCLQGLSGHWTPLWPR